MSYMQVHSPELLRQHEAHMARRRRIEAASTQPPPTPAPQPTREKKRPARTRYGYDSAAHVAVWRLHQLKRDWLHVSDGGGARVKVSSVIDAVCDYYNVSRADLLSQRRTANVVRPRQIAMYLAKTLTLRSLPEIARSLGGRDHTTILHGVQKVGALMVTDKALASEVATLRAKIEGRCNEQ